MPYKRSDSPYYYIRRRQLLGYGDTGRISSGVTSKRIAADMERCLEEVAAKALLDPAWRDLLDAVCKSRTLPPAELLAARNRGTLHALKKRLADPPLEAAIAQYLAHGVRDRNVELGLQQVQAAAPPGARLSIFRDGTYITRFLSGLEGPDRKRNTVCRQAKRAISLLLRYHLGNAERDRIFADVHYEAEDDTRQTYLSPQDIQRLFDACEEFGYHELAVIIMVALQTSADRGVMLSGPGSHGRYYRGILSRDVEIFRDNETGRYSGHVYLNDGKTQDRSRTIPITDRLCRELLVCLKGKRPDQPVFDVQYRDLDYPWKRVRQAAGLTDITLKDLRHQFAIYAQRASVPGVITSRAMGHASETMTARYRRYAAEMTHDQAAAIEAAMYGKTG